MSTKGTLDKDYDEEEIEKKFAPMIEKQANNWACKACERISSRKGNLKKHAKKHIKGITLFNLWQNIQINRHSTVS